MQHCKAGYLSFCTVLQSVGCCLLFCLISILLLKYEINPSWKKTYHSLFLGWREERRPFFQVLLSGVLIKISCHSKGHRVPWRKKNSSQVNGGHLDVGHFDVIHDRLQFL